MSAAVIIASSIWMYFLTPSLKYLAYAPTIILGIGLSAMLVMALAFTTALIEDNKVCTLAQHRFHNIIPFKPWPNTLSNRLKSLQNIAIGRRKESQLVAQVHKRTIFLTKAAQTVKKYAST